MAAPTITLRVPPSTEAALNSMSEATGRPVGDLVRQGIAMLLADQDEDALLSQLEEARTRRDEATRQALRAATEANRVRLEGRRNR